MRFADKNGSLDYQIKKKSNAVKLDNLNPALLNYISGLEPEYQNMILATSGNDSKHSKNSRHYSNNAIDLRYNKILFDRIATDPNRLKSGITLLDPNHGTAPHIHISVGNGKENTNDVWMNPYSDKTKQYLNSLEKDSVGESGKDVVQNTTNNVVKEISVPVFGVENMPGLQELIKSNTESMLMMDQKMKALQEEKQIKEQAQQEAAAIRKKRIDRLSEKQSLINLISNSSLEGVDRGNKRQFMSEGGQVNPDNLIVNTSLNKIKDEISQLESVQDEDLSHYDQTIQLWQGERERLNKNLNKIIEQANSVVGFRNEQIYSQNNDASSDEKISTHNNNKLTGKNTTEKLIKALSDLELQGHQISGAIGSLSEESFKELSPTAENSRSKAFGIAQWLGSRLIKLKQFSKDNNMDYTSSDAQIKFLVHELQTTHKNTLRALKSTSNVEDATDVWTNTYEIPSEREKRVSRGRRIRHSKDVLKQYFS